MKGKNSVPLRKYRPAFLAMAVICWLLGACSSQQKLTNNYIYFKGGEDTVLVQNKETTIEPNDLLTIQVSSRTLNQEQAAIFNLPVAAGAQSQGYTVNGNGNIVLPIIGAVRAAGLTRDQLQSSLGKLLTDYVKNPTVIVKFMQFNVNVLGEVKTPGTKTFQSDKVTIIDAISAAGDLTDYGKREDVKVIREADGKRITYTVDLRSRNLFDSPVYVLEPNDIVYVTPNKYKLKSISVDPEKQRNTSLFFTIFSSIVGIASLIVFATRK